METLLEVSPRKSSRRHQAWRPARGSPLQFGLGIPGVVQLPVHKPQEVAEMHER